jgi:hypothetical protein
MSPTRGAFPAMPLLVLALGACRASDDMPATTPAPDAKAPISVSSTIPGLRLVATDVLPPAPDAPPVGDFCVDEEIEATSPGARAAKALGWIVVGDEPLGTYRAVAVFRDAGNGTSGACLVHDGSVVVFDGARVVAIAYDPAVPEDATSNLGGMSAAATPDRVRLWPGWPGPPVADLVATGSALAIAPFPASEPACDGALQVPMLYGEDIFGARAKLLSAGWQPSPPEVAQSDYQTAPLEARGVVETQACSGTGFAYCAFAYERPDGASLGLTTIGEHFGVVGYDVACGPEGGK